MNDLRLRFLRWLGMRAPADGLCNEWTWRRITTDRYEEVTIRTERYRCVFPWGHGDDYHELIEIGSFKWHEQMRARGHVCVAACRWCPAEVVP